MAFGQTGNWDVSSFCLVGVSTYSIVLIDIAP